MSNEQAPDDNVTFTWVHCLAIGWSTGMCSLQALLMHDIRQLGLTKDLLHVSSAVDTSTAARYRSTRCRASMKTGLQLYLVCIPMLCFTCRMKAALVLPNLK